MRARYRQMLLQRFPQLTIDIVGRHNDVGTRWCAATSR